MHGGFQVEPSRLRDAADDMRDIHAGLATAAGRLGASPDAGRSSGEVAGALAKLSSATSALGAAVLAMAGGLDDSAAAYEQADARTGACFDGLLPGSAGP